MQGDFKGRKTKAPRPGKTKAILERKEQADKKTALPKGLTAATVFEGDEKKTTKKREAVTVRRFGVA